MLVRDNMTRDVIATTPDQSLRMAGERMRKHNVRRLPVVRDGKLKGGTVVGIITDTDILGAFIEMLESSIDSQATTPTQRGH